MLRTGMRDASVAPVEVILRRVGRLLLLLAVAGSLPVRSAALLSVGLKFRFRWRTRTLSSRTFMRVR